MIKIFSIMQMILHHLNAPRMICDHLFNEHHNHKHRMAVGGFIMITGVYIAKSATHVHFAVVEMGADLLGYLVHGIGAVPYVDALMTVIKSNNGPVKKLDE